MIKGKTILITGNCQCLKLRNMWNVGTSDLPREPDNCIKGNWQYTSILLRKGGETQQVFRGDFMF